MSVKFSMSEASAILSKETRSLKRSRRSYTREEKIRVVSWYKENDSNLYKTCKKFTLNTKTVMRWIKDEEKIKKSKKGTKRVMFIRSAQFPLMEEQLHAEFRQLRIKIKGWWFKNRAKQIFNEQYPGQNFSFLDGWFAGFKKRYKISLRRATNSCQKPPESKKEAIRHFHHLIREISLEGEQVDEKLGRFHLS